MGLASLSVPRDDLEAATADFVAALLAAPKPALAALKPLLREAVTATPDEQLVHERTAQGQLLHGMAAGATARRP